MKFFNRNKGLIKYSTLLIIGASAGCIYYQMHRTNNILNHLLDTSVINAIHPTIREKTNKTAASNELLDITSIQIKTNNNIILQTWQSIKFGYARRLLNLAHSDSSSIRHKAIKSLANLKKLDSYHCSLLANMIDAKTAVTLARTKNSDSRLLMEPPLRYLTYNRTMLINAMKDLLLNLYEKSQHPCLGYFISKIFVDDTNISATLDIESTSMELHKFIQSHSDILELCLESLLHHSSIKLYAKDIIQYNGLPLLLEVHNRFKHDAEVSVTLCRIISYLSFNAEALVPIFKSGWIGILAEWINHKDVRISVPAARALANLDPDSGVIYPRSVYLLHPLKNSRKWQHVDVVFVHGLLGGVFFTWRQRTRLNETALGFTGKVLVENERASISPDSSSSKKLKENKLSASSDPKLREYAENVQQYLTDTTDLHDYEIVWEDLPIEANANIDDGCYACSCDELDPYIDDTYTFCWPKDWLPNDCKNIRILGINYDTSLSMWASSCPSEKFKFTLDERSDELLGKLLKAGLGTRPIVWVTHSMGGLIVKNIINKAFESEVLAIRNICSKTKGIVFYSTPHTGSRLANLSQATALLLWPSVEVQELRQNSTKLMEIHRNFLEILKSVPIKIVTIVETKATVVSAMKFNFLLVERESGNPGVGEYYEVPQDHLSICKPINRYSFLYRKVLDLVKEVLEEHK